MKLGWSLYWRTFLVHIVLMWALSPLTSGILRSADFIKLGPSVFYATFACSLAISLFVSKEGLLHVVAGPRLALSSNHWRHFTLAITCLFATLVVLNVVVAFTQSTEFWVNSKLAMGALPFVFTMGYGIWLQRQLANRSTAARTSQEVDSPGGVNP